MSFDEPNIISEGESFDGCYDNDDDSDSNSDNDSDDDSDDGIIILSKDERR